MKATQIKLLDFKSVPMRTFHITWITFFLCFFGWFGIAPLMPVVRENLGLTKGQIGNIIIASVAITIFARLFFGWLCDRIGPRISYTILLLLGSIPVMCIGFSNSYESFLLFRLAIGMIGASFVITQYHTSVMFAPNIVGTANATTAGWGNMGGGAAQVLMPLLFSAIVALGASEAVAWRLAMVVPGILMLFGAVAYYLLTQDRPAGNVPPVANRSESGVAPKRSGFMEALTDPRVLALALLYGACFGVEITIHNIAALYFVDTFQVGLKSAGLIVGMFGLLAIFARTLGGWSSDRVSRRFGLGGRTIFLGAAVVAEGL